jgi:hypothetical protein
MEDAADVRAKNFFEGPLYRHATKMHDGIDALDQVVDRLFIGEIAELDFFVGKCFWGDSGDIGKTQGSGEGAQAFAQNFTETASSARQQNAIERRLSVEFSHRGDPDSDVVFMVSSVVV